MNIDAFLFDLDGTLIDSSKDLANAVNRLRHKLDLTELADEVALSFVGDGATLLVQRALPPGMYRPEHLQLFLSLYADHLIEHSHCYPGIRAFLDHHRHLPLAVVSNKPYQLAIDLLRGLDLIEPFSVIIGGDSLSEKKPHPLPIIHAAKQLNVSLENCVMIGDHHTDLRSAQAAGVASCFCNYGFGCDDGAAHTWRVNSADELLTLFP